MFGLEPDIQRATEMAIELARLALTEITGGPRATPPRFNITPDPEQVRIFEEATRCSARPRPQRRVVKR